jgi:hypothetical protein
MINLNPNNEYQNTSFGTGTLKCPDPIKLARKFFYTSEFTGHPNQQEIKQAKIFLDRLNNTNNKLLKPLLERMPDNDIVEIAVSEGEISINLLAHPDNFNKYKAYNFTDKTGSTPVKSILSDYRNKNLSPLSKNINDTIETFTKRGINFLDEHLIPQTKNS